MFGSNCKTDLRLSKLKDLGVTKATLALFVTATFISIVELGGASLGVTITELSVGTVGISRTGLSTTTFKVKAKPTGTFHIVITLISNGLLSTAQVWVVCVAVFKQLGVTKTSFTLVIVFTLSTNRKLATNDAIAGLANGTWDALGIVSALGDTDVSETLAIRAVLVVVAVHIHAGVINNLSDAFALKALVTQTLFTAIASASVDALVLTGVWTRVAPLIRGTILGAVNIYSVDNKHCKVRT